MIKLNKTIYFFLIFFSFFHLDQQKTKSNLVEENTIPDEAVLSDKKSSPDKLQIKIAKSPENDVKTAAAKKTNLKRKSSESKGKVGNKVTGKEAVEKSEHYEASQDVSSKAVVNIKQKDEEYVSELLETVEVGMLHRIEDANTFNLIEFMDANFFFTFQKSCVRVTREKNNVLMILKKSTLQRVFCGFFYM